MGQAQCDPNSAGMKKYLFIALTLACGFVAKADSFNLDAHGSLTVSIPASWAVTGSELPGKAGYDIKILSKSGANAACRITVIYSGNSELPDKEKARAFLLKRIEPLVDLSAEKKAVLKDFSLKSGFGMYCSFTDAGQVGKPSVNGHYKTMSPGVIYLSKDIAISVTIFTDDLSGPEFQELLGLVQSIVLVPPSPVY
jgi:hypothetical protein